MDKGKNKQPDPVCYCFEVYEDEIRSIIRDKHVMSVPQLQMYCQAGTGCGTCRSDLEQLISDENKKKAQGKKG
jgi:bacterioferritin-associated ferredoxin